MLDIQDRRPQDYLKNSSKCKDEEQPCVLCGKPVKNLRYMVHVHCGGGVIVTETEAQGLSDDADLGFYPIGSHCLRANPDINQYLSIEY